MQAMYGTAGYSNSVTDDLMTQISESLTTLAQASAQDRIAVANVATNNTTILDQLTQAIATITTVQARLTLIEGRIGGANGGGNGSNGANWDPRRNNRNQDNKSSCHTHVRTRRNDHTSTTCDHPADGHIAKTTLGNKQSGSTCYC